MFSHPLYLLYGIGLLGIASIGGMQGWLSTKPDVVKDVPKTVRDNPGAYRSHYAYYSRYTGGK